MQGAVQPPRGARALASLVAGRKAVPLPVPWPAQHSLPVTPNTKRTLHAFPCKDWVTPEAKTCRKEKLGKKM